MEDFFFSYVPIAFAATLLLVCLAASFHRFGKKRRLPPLKGSFLHQLLHFNRIHDYHTDLAGESKTFRLLEPGSRSDFYTVDPLVVEHVLRTNFAKYGKGFYNYNNLKDLLGDGIFAVDGERWRHQRKLSSYEFSTKNLRDFSSDVFRKAAAKLAAAISNSARSNKAVDIQDLFMRSTMDSIFKVGFGLELDTLSGLSEEGKAFARAFDEAGDLVLWRYADPSWMIKRLFNVGSEATLRKDIKIIDEFIYKLISNKKELLSKQQNQNQAVGKQDMLSRFLVEKENDSENMNDKYLRDIILNIIIAGRDTTAITLSWFFYMLCKHSSLQDQLAREVEDSTGADHCCTDMTAGFTSTLTEAALSKMQFLHAALTETLRLHPAIPEDPKICFCDDTLPGCWDIKEGDMICYLPYSMGRMKFLWGEDAEDFRPERWLDENGAFQAENPFKFTAFQAGPRICLGKDFAYLQMKIVSAVLLHFFRFELKDESRNVRYKSSITLRIDGGLELLASHRQSVDTVD